MALKPRFQIVINKKRLNRLITPQEWTDVYDKKYNNSIVNDHLLLLQADTININSNIDNLTETSDIYISKRYVNKQKDNTVTFSFKFDVSKLSDLGMYSDLTPTTSYDVVVQLGDSIEINLTQNINKNWNDINPTEFDKQGLFLKRFMGHIYAFAENSDFIILKCEDNMGILKKASRKTFTLKTLDKDYLKTVDPVKSSLKDITITQNLKGLIDAINLLWRDEGVHIILDERSNLSLIDISLEGLVIQNLNPGEILEFIKSKYSTFVYFFKKNYFYAGFVTFTQYFGEIGQDAFSNIWRFTDPFLPGYDDQAKGSLPDIGNGCNPVISSDLDFKTISNNSLMIVYTSSNPIIEGKELTKTKLIVKYTIKDNKDVFSYELTNDVNKEKDVTNYNKAIEWKEKFSKSGTTIKEKDFQYKTAFNVERQSVTDIESFCKAAYQKTPKTGYSGSFTTFGIPPVNKGDLLLLNLSARYDKFNTDPDSDYIFNIKIQKDRSVFGKDILDDNDISEIKVPFWLYYAKGVDITYSTDGGYRQKIYIEKQVPFIKQELIKYGEYPDTVKTFVKKIKV